MPTYLYSCENCGEFEARASIHSDSKTARCLCGAQARKLFVSPQISPRVTGMRRQGPPAGNRNSWEKGIATDHRGAPLLGENGKEIPLKRYAEKRSFYEERRRFLNSHPDPFGGVAAQTAKEGR